MGRPKKELTPEIKVMTLQELEILWGEYLGKPPENPIETNPNYFAYCRSNPTFWRANMEKRMAQLQKLHLIETTVIDYYQNTQQPYWV